MALSIQAAISKDKASGKSVELQHRHFAFIASILLDTKPDSTWLPEMDHWNSTVMAFTRACQRSNPLFDIARFHTACGYGQ